MRWGESAIRPFSSTAVVALLGTWSALGVLAALQAAWRTDVHVDLGLLLILHVPHWTAWAGITVLVAALDRRFLAGGRARRLTAHAALCIAVILAHAVFVAGWDVAVLGNRIAVPWSTIFARPLKGSGVLEVLGYAVVLSLVLGRRPGLPAPPRRTDGVRVLSIPLGRSVERVPFDDITHVEAASNYVRVFTSARRLALRKPLGALQRELDEGFVRIHRSCIVNLAHVARVVSRGRRQRWVVLRNGRELKASAAGWRRIQTVIS